MNELITEILYKCPICGDSYTEKEEAQKCLDKGLDTLIVEVGDIVEAKYGFGWFDGDKKWIINPDVDMSRHGFGRDHLMGFYYVVTAIDTIEHKTRYHLATKAMSGDKGYRIGYTFSIGHHKPKPINAPDYVKKDSKDLIGLEAKYLL